MDKKTALKLVQNDEHKQKLNEEIGNSHDITKSNFGFKDIKL